MLPQKTYNEARETDKGISVDGDNDTVRPACINEDAERYRNDISLLNSRVTTVTEITLMTSAKRTAVCCLSSVNVELEDEWCDHPHFIADIIRLLDNVLEYFIQLAPEELWRAIRSAKKERAVGLN